jgi:hypothetical protein
MAGGGDTVAGGAGTGDKLDVNFAAIIGGTHVDLSSATDQVVSINGAAGSGTVTGFESVDLSGYSGSFGALVTGSKGANTVHGTTNADQANLGAGNDIYVLDDVTLDTVNGQTGTNTLALVGGVTIASTIDFGTYTNFDNFKAYEASASVFSLTLKADADSDMADLRTIDLSGDTNTTGSNVVDLSAVDGTYTVTGSSGIDTITTSLGVDAIDVSASSNDIVIIKTGASTGVLTAGAASTTTATMDVITVEAGDKVNVTGIVATDASFDTLAAATTSGNFTLTVIAKNSLQAVGIYDATADTFTHSNTTTGNAVMVTFAAGDSATTGTDSLIFSGVTAVTDFENGIFTV